VTHRSRRPLAEGPPSGALVEAQRGRSPETQPTVGWTGLTVRCPLERLLRVAVERRPEGVPEALSEHAELHRELLQTVRRELGPVAVIGHLSVVAMLPKTRSGKIT
jgi:hypothetical protein